MVKAFIFDVDGTLVDSVDAHAEAWRRAFAAFGHDVEFAAIRSQIGKGGDQLMPEFLSKEEIEKNGEALEKERKAVFQRDYLPGIKGFPEVRALFERLEKGGFKLALASSAKGDELEAYKKAAGIEHIRLAETSSDDAEKSKPHPDIFEAALERLKLRPEDCIVVGDTPYDADAAGKAGIRTTGVLCGGFAEADIRAGGAQWIYRDPADLLAHVEHWIAELDG